VRSHPKVVADEVITGGFPSEEARITAALEAGWLPQIAGTHPKPGLKLPDAR